MDEGGRGRKRWKEIEEVEGGGKICEKKLKKMGGCWKRLEEVKLRLKKVGRSQIEIERGWRRAEKVKIRLWKAEEEGRWLKR